MGAIKELYNIGKPQPILVITPVTRKSLCLYLSRSTPAISCRNSFKATSL